MPSQVLALTADMPVLQLATGDVLYGQGDDSSHSVAKACIGYDATIVIDDMFGEVPVDPFVGEYSEVYKADGPPTGEIVYCSESPLHADCL